MSYTIELNETFTSIRDIHSIFDYIADFSTIEQWDHTVINSTKTSAGKTGLGSNFDILLKFGFSSTLMKYSISEYEAPNRLVLTGQGNGYVAIDTVTLVQDGDLVTVNWKADIIFKGALSKLAPVMQSRVVASAKKTIVGLANALNDNFPAPTLKTKTKIVDKLLLSSVYTFTKWGYSKAKKSWHPDSADITGKHIVITGSTSGIGLSAAYDLAHRKAKLTLVARNPGKAELVKNQIIETTGNINIDIKIADMSLITDVRKLAKELLEENKGVDVLVNNAGNLFNPRQETNEGLEQSFALLLLAPYILTEALYPLLRQSQGRVINVSSGGMYTQRINPNDLESQTGQYSGSVAYAKAKRGLMICTEEWAKKWQDDGIIVNAMHPGWAETPSVINALPEFYKLTKNILRNPRQGGDTISWLAASTQAGKVSGEFFLDREPHMNYVLRSTMESNAERALFLNKLEDYAKRQFKRTKKSPA